MSFCQPFRQTDGHFLMLLNIFCIWPSSFAAASRVTTYCWWCVIYRKHTNFPPPQLFLSAGQGPPLTCIIPQLMDMVVGRYDDVAIVSVIVILVTVFLFLALFNTDSPSGDMDSCILHLPNHLTALWRSVVLHCVYGFMVEVAISFVVTVPQ